MSCQEEVIRIGKKLEKMISNDAQDSAVALDLLNTLKKLPMTLDVLQKTHIGMTVNNFRKGMKNDEVISLSKTLIKSWKKLLPTDNSQKELNRSNSTASVDTKESESSVKKEDQLDAAVQSAEDTGGSNDDEKPKSKAQITKAEDTTDSIRIKCRQMLTQALEIAGHIEGAPEFSDVAAAIEDCVYKEFENTDAKYKTRIRSRVSNLKDSRNPKLRQSVLLGDISPDRIAVMTSEEMASEDLKELRARFTKESIDDHQMATTSGTKTDLLKCGKCGKRNCTYNQVQTRSADEPMTTFVFCNECGNRWKFC